MEQRIGVIGAGVMGKGVAQRFAKYGYRVILLDNNPEVLKNAAGEIYRDLKVKACLINLSRCRKLWNVFP